MAILEQEQRVLSPYAGSVVRFLLIRDEKDNNKLIPLVQVVTPTGIVRMNSSKLRSIIGFLTAHLKKGCNNSYLSRSINREFSARIFTINDRPSIFNNALKIFRAISDNIKKISETGDTTLLAIPDGLKTDNSNPLKKEGTEFVPYFNKTINDTRRPLTFCRIIDSKLNKGITILEMGSCGHTLRFPIFNRRDGKVPDEVHALVTSFDSILNDFYTTGITPIEFGSLMKVNHLYYRITDDRNLVLNYESDFDIENSKMMTDNSEKTSFILNTVIKLLTNRYY